MKHIRDILGLALFVAAAKTMHPETLVRLLDKVNASLADMRS